MKRSGIICVLLIVLYIALLTAGCSGIGKFLSRLPEQRDMVNTRAAQKGRNFY